MDLVQQIVQVIDHTNIRPDATLNDIERLCNEAIRYGFRTVCVNPYYVDKAKRILRDTGIKVSGTCGFPFGTHRTQIKVREAEDLINSGVDEIDMVINIGALKSRRYRYVEDELEQIRRICARNGVILKVILEMNLLTREEKTEAVRIADNAGADIIKTGTGLWGPAKYSDVRIIRKLAPGRGIKPAGGIRTPEQIIRFLKSGATRIGTSTGVQIVRKAKRCNV